VTDFNKRGNSRFTVCSAIAILAAVNVVIFRNHYFGTDCFPWDFWKLYYAIIPFWTTAVGQHLLPEWVPFEAMGYPLFLNLQSSFFYPPLWLFVLPGFHYSLHVAVIVQCLHVFWGACGAFFLLRVLTNDWRSALFGSLAYQFFGGFYSNAEHMDIIRAYSWLPWLFWGATVKETLGIRNFLLPAIFFCVATASYPGNLISHSFLVGVYLLWQFYQPSERSNRRDVLVVAGLLGLGLMLSAVAIGPAFLLRDQLTRASVKLPTASWSFPQWLSLITPWVFEELPIPGYGGDVSMISAFVGVPAVMLIMLIPGKTAKRYAVWWLLLILAATLALGHLSTVYNIAVAIVPVLGLSRMASSDYRGVVGLALIVLSSASLSEFLAATKDRQRQLVQQRFKYLCLVPLVVMSGVFGVFMPEQEIIWLAMIWAATLAALRLQWSKPLAWQRISYALLCALVLAGGWHVLSVSSWTWTAGGTDVNDLYRRRAGFSTSAWPLPIAEKVHGMPTRPARVDRKRADFSWSGYLDGTYQMNDWSNTVLKARAQIEASSVLRQYMRLPLTVTVFPQTQEVSLAKVRERLAQDPATPQSEVVPAKYGVNTIIYDVTLAANSVIVENEVWFPGWKGRLLQKSKNTDIQAVSVDKTLRAWRLPAGQYTLITEFRTPYLRGCIILSIIGLAIYSGLLLIRYRTGRVSGDVLPQEQVHDLLNPCASHVSQIGFPHFSAIGVLNNFVARKIIDV
jgi:hypothetical protein